MVGFSLSIVANLGEGVMGVYKARDTRLERFVAWKSLPEDPAHDKLMRERFLREALAPLRPYLTPTSAKSVAEPAVAEPTGFYPLREHLRNKKILNPFHAHLLFRDRQPDALHVFHLVHRVHFAHPSRIDIIEPQAVQPLSRQPDGATLVR